MIRTLPSSAPAVFVASLLTLTASHAFGQQVLHRVHINETLSSIARDYYGDAHKAPFLARVNGLASHAKLDVASRLRIPSSWIYVARRRTSLRALAKRFLGDSRRYLALQVFNPKFRRKTRVRRNARVIMPFSVTHTVSTEDTFLKLARVYYRDDKRAKLIARYNFLKGSRPAPGSTLRIPIASVQITPTRLQDLTNERVLGIADGEPDLDRQALIEANASLRQGKYSYVPLALLRMLARKVPFETRVVDVFKLLAVAYVALQRRDLAVLAFREALLRQPNLQLSPMNTSPKVIEAFHEAQSKNPRPAH
ncbi:MAG: LysM peptidoglycan-binding domain-containing protein [Deltaproteobacteria bacterium]|nr:LysM peptidoglycan-binding domain-containing protein [Deltaproteobacteria bacterium]